MISSRKARGWLIFLSCLVLCLGLAMSSPRPARAYAVLGPGMGPVAGDPDEPVPNAPATVVTTPTGRSRTSAGVHGPRTTQMTQPMHETQRPVFRLIALIRGYLYTFSGI